MSSNFEQLLKYVQDLRNSEQGCPWTKAQTIDSLLPQTLEEAYEFIHAYQHQSESDFNDELGDLLYHVAFYCVIMSEQSGVALDQEMQQRIEKIINKHEQRLPPKSERANYTPEQINTYWQQQKQSSAPKQKSVLAKVTAELPAMLRAMQIQSTVADVGFDWENAGQVIDKLKEETDELQAEVTATVRDKCRIQDEIGDILFTCVNLARHCKIDPEIALHDANEKFIKRFQRCETIAEGQQINFAESPLATLESLWQQAKKEEANND